MDNPENKRGWVAEWYKSFISNQKSNIDTDFDLHTDTNVKCKSVLSSCMDPGLLFKKKDNIVASTISLKKWHSTGHCHLRYIICITFYDILRDYVKLYILD